MDFGNSILCKGPSPVRQAVIAFCYSTRTLSISLSLFIPPKNIMSGSNITFIQKLQTQQLDKHTKWSHSQPSPQLNSLPETLHIPIPANRINTIYRRHKQFANSFHSSDLQHTHTHTVDGNDDAASRLLNTPSGIECQRDRQTHSHRETELG